jgi:predicted N-acetyltransferase YhbS
MNEQPTVRVLTPADLDRIVSIDQALTGRNRRAWYERKLTRALSGSDVRISLGAVVDGILVGALLGEVQYGEFGQPEPVALLDTLLVDRGFARRGVGRALFDQLLKNLSALRIEKIRTEVGWTEQELVAFLAHAGFAPAPRLVLELDVARAAAARSREEVAAEA